MLLAFALTAGMLAGCGSDPVETEGPKETDAPKTTEAPTEGNVPETLEGDLDGDGTLSEWEKCVANIPGGVPDLSGYTISLLTLSSDVAEYPFSDILAIYKQVEELTGVTLVWEEASWNDYPTIKQLRLSEEKLPDIFYDLYNTSKSQMAAYIEQGMIFDFSKAFDVAPNIKTWYEVDNPAFYDSFVYTDGGIYTVPTARYTNAEEQAMCSTNGEETLVYRKDIAEELGFTETPETINDWYELLSAVKKAYPDMIPFNCANLGAWGVDDLGVWGSAWGIQSNTAVFNTFINTEDGGVEYQLVSDEMKAFVTEMEKWYDEGLISFTGANDNRTALPLQNQVFAFDFSVATFMNRIDELRAIDADAMFEAAPLPTVEGYEAAYMGRQPYDSFFFVGDNGDDDQARAAVTFMDFTWFSEYGKYLNNYGVMGPDTWYFDENGEVVFVEEFVDALLGGTLEKGAKANQQGGKGWHRTPMEYFYCEEIVTKQAAATLANKGEEYVNAVQTQKDATAINLKNLKAPFAMPYFSEEDADQYDFLMGDIITYTHEAFANFIAGERDLSEWDEYVKFVNEDLGLEEVIAILEKYK